MKMSDGKDSVKADRQESDLALLAKGFAINLAVLVAIPIVVPLLFAGVTYSAIKDKLIKCPRCAGKRLELKGQSRTTAEAPGPEGDWMNQRSCGHSRNSPNYSYYLCLDCGSQSKKTFGDPLQAASEEEFADMVPVTDKAASK
jgi:DNA-directed RNA polymerase subunit RPC12/RpoP